MVRADVFGRAFSRIGRIGTQVRFVVTGVGEDEDEM
jgi:hypothetical protein